MHFQQELLGLDVCAACSTVERPIALNTTLLWDISGIEGKKEQVEHEEQVQEADQDEQMKSWKIRMRTLEQCGRWQVKEASQSKQEAVQKP